MADQTKIETMLSDDCLTDADRFALWGATGPADYFRIGLIADCITEVSHGHLLSDPPSDLTH